MQPNKILIFGASALIATAAAWFFVTPPRALPEKSQDPTSHASRELRSKPIKPIPPTSPSSQAHEPTTATQVSQRNEALENAIRAAFRSDNYRATVQKALITRDAAGVRAASELISYCDLLKLNGDRVRDHISIIPGSLLEEFIWREKACASSGGIDRSQKYSLRALEKSMERTPEFAYHHLIGVASEIAALNESRNAFAIARWGSLAIAKSKDAVLGKEGALSGMPEILADLAWQAAACRVHQCDELYSLVGNCFDQNTCRLTLGQRYELQAESYGLSKAQWREIEQAMAIRVQFLFPRQQ